MIKTTDNQNELFVVVDENDKIICYRTRKDCHYDKKLIHRAVDIVVTNIEGKILLQKRSKTKDLYPGMYSVAAAGHVKKGETYEQTALRELKEELGIKIPLLLTTRFISRAPKETEMIAVFVGTYDGLFKIDTKEVEKAAFFTKNEIKKFQSQMHPGSKLTFQSLGII